jgi:hypothetical protein
MISEEELERQIRRALVTRAAEVHLAAGRPPTRTCAPIREASEFRRRQPWLRRPWGLVALPAAAALVATIVVLGSGPGPHRQQTAAQAPGAAGRAVTGGVMTPPVRRTAGGVVLVGEGRWRPQGAGAGTATRRYPSCGVGLPPRLVHGLRAADCLESMIQIDPATESAHQLRSDE